MNSYEMVKARFELNCCKVKKPFCYARNVPDSDPYLHSHGNLKYYYCDWKYWKLDMYNTYKKFPFISAWLQDPKKRVVETLESINKDPAKTLKELNFKANSVRPRLLVEARVHFNKIYSITKNSCSVRVT